MTASTHKTLDEYVISRARQLTAADTTAELAAVLDMTPDASPGIVYGAAYGACSVTMRGLLDIIAKRDAAVTVLAAAADMDKIDSLGSLWYDAGRQL